MLLLDRVPGSGAGAAILRIQIPYDTILAVRAVESNAMMPLLSELRWPGKLPRMNLNRCPHFYKVKQLRLRG